MNKQTYKSVRANGKTYSVYTSEDSYGNSTSSVNGDFSNFSTPTPNHHQTHHSDYIKSDASVASYAMILPVISVLGGLIIVGGIILALILCLGGH